MLSILPHLGRAYSSGLRYNADTTMKSRLKHKRAWQRMVYSYPVIGGLLLIAGFLSINVYERYLVAVEMKERTERVEAQLDDLQARQQQLEARVEYLKDESGREAEIRKHFDVARPDEQVVIIVDDPALEVESDQVAAPAAAVLAPKPWYQFW